METGPIIRDQKPGMFRFDSGADTSPKRLALLIGGGVAILLLTLWLFSGGDEPAAEPAPLVAPAPPTPAPAAPAQAAPIGPPAASAAQIVLHGVMGTGTDGAAIIAIGGGAQRLVRVGREIAPGLPLLAIANTHILVGENGQEVRIGFPDAPTNSPVASGGGASAPAPRTASREALRRAAVEYQAGLSAVDGEGRTVGYTVREGRVPPGFAEAGIRPGDVVLRVGGTELESPDDVERIPREMQSGGEIEIEIIRGGVRQTISSGRR